VCDREMGEECDDLVAPICMECQDEEWMMIGDVFPGPEGDDEGYSL